MDTVSGTVAGGTVVGGTVVGATVVGGVVVVGMGAVVVGIGAVVVGIAVPAQPQSSSITISMQKIRFISSFAFFFFSWGIIPRRSRKSKKCLHFHIPGV